MLCPGKIDELNIFNRAITAEEAGVVPGRFERDTPWLSAEPVSQRTDGRFDPAAVTFDATGLQPERIYDNFIYQLQ
jgi:hypothetical protein